MLTNHSLCAMLNSEVLYFSLELKKREGPVSQNFPPLLGALIVGSLQLNILAENCGVTLKGLIYFLF